MALGLVGGLPSRGGSVIGSRVSHGAAGFSVSVNEDQGGLPAFC